MNHIDTWQQGQYDHQQRDPELTPRQVKSFKATEARSVRSGPHGDRICQTQEPQDAIWIAQRLNLASKLEQMVQDLAAGKTDPTALINFASNNG